MKRLKHIINWTIWSLVTLYLLLVVLIHLPVVQGYLGEKVAHVISEKLATEVSVGRVDLGFFTRIIIDDVAIKDQNRENLLNAGRMSVKVDLLPLAGGQLQISSAQLFNINVNLYQTDSLAKPNFQFVIDSLSSKDESSKSTLNLKVNSLIIRRATVSYNRRYLAETPGQLNANHLQVSDVSAHIAIKHLSNDSANINIKRLAFKEKSGLMIKRLSTNLLFSQSNINTSQLLLEMPQTRLHADTLQVHHNNYNLLTFTGTIHDSFVTPADLKSIFPQLAHLNTPIGIHLSAHGSKGLSTIEELQLSTHNHSLDMNATGFVNTATPRTTWTANILQMNISQSIIKDLREAFGGKLPNFIEQIGDVRLTGRMEMTPTGNLLANSKLHTDIGSVTGDIRLEANNTVEGNVSTDSLKIGILLNNEDLGFLAADIHVSGNTDRLNTVANVSRLDYKLYTYHDIAMKGMYSPASVSANIVFNDPNLSADVEGAISLAQKPSIRMTGFIQRITPKALNLSEKWGDATFSAIVDADFSASSLNDAEGTIDIDDFRMMTPSDDLQSYYIDNLHIKSGYDEGEHYLKARGDMGEISLKGQFDWHTLPESFTNYVASKLPTLPGLNNNRTKTHNNFELEVNLNETLWLEKLVGISLRLEKPLHLTAMLNDETKEMNIMGQMPTFAYNNASYEGAYIRLSTENDTTFCEAELNKIMDNGRRTMIAMTAKASDNQLTSSFNWDNSAQWSNDHTQAMYGTINTITQLYTNEQGSAEAHIRVLPSQMHIHGTNWELDPCDILYSDKSLIVDHLKMYHGQQHLIVDGIASESSNDSLLVDLGQLEVEYILDLVNFHSVSFGGQASGRVCANGVFGDFNMKADLTVDDFKFQEGHMGTLYAKALWNNASQQIDIDAVSDNGPLSKTYIQGYVSPKRENIDLDIRAMNSPLDFCNSFTSSFLKDVSGQGNGNLRLIGPLGEMDLLGALTVNGKATVDALNTTYTLEGDTIQFVTNDILFQSFSIYDKQHHVGVVTGGLHHDHLSDFEFDINIQAENLLAYDFPEFINGSNICGNVYATGLADLHGHGKEIIINCNVTPQPGTTFSYNAANPDAISQQQFITWGSADTPLSANENGQQNKFNTSTEIDNKTITSSDLYINFLINATPDATMRILMDQNTGDCINLQGQGTIRAQYYDKGAFQMFGTYGIQSGTYGITIQNIIKKNFLFQPDGNIIFRGDPFQANLNLQALYTVNGVSLSDLNIGNSFSNTVRVNCLMNITGTAGEPHVEFDLDLPNVNAEEKQMIRSVIASEQEMNQQVLYLLGIGRFYTQGANNAEQQQYGQTELAMQSFLSGTVSTQLNTLLSQVVKSNDWNFGANISTGNEGWHNAEYEGIVNGRLLNNRLLINGQFGYRDNAKQATPSFIGDFDLRYLLYPSGNLALKVYNQTNDRYFTRSSLNTQGVGLIMKKDFNSLGELFRKK